MVNFLDIFAGAGGLSEGFVRAGYSPICHIEMDAAACYTLRTRAAFHYLMQNGGEEIYRKYLIGEISRDELYSFVPKEVINSVIQEEISDSSISNLFNIIDGFGKKIDLIIGGPPCQAYSLAGRSRDPNRMIGDKRNYLYALYAEFLERFQPKYFVFENVIGLLSAKDEDGELYLSKMRSLFNEKGYNTELRVLDSSLYGVLQKRKRIIIIGKKGDDSGFYPEIETSIIKFTVDSIFSDLPSIHAGEGSCYGINEVHHPSQYLINSKIHTNNLPITFHCARPNNSRDLEIYKLAVELWNEGHKRLNYASLPDSLRTHKNSTSFTDRFKVVAGDLYYSQTVVAHISKDGHYYIHPDIDQNRSLTPREAARLQTFPDDYFFESVTGRPSRTYAFKQIGNAVPVLLAEKVAKAMNPLFKDSETHELS